MREAFYVSLTDFGTLDVVIIGGDRELGLFTSLDDAIRARIAMGQRANVRVLALDTWGRLYSAICRQPKKWRNPRFWRWRQIRRRSVLPISPGYAYGSNRKRSFAWQQDPDPQLGGLFPQ